MRTTDKSTANSFLTQRASLFSPLDIKDVTLRNRIAVSPMCQYSSLDGFANDWHLVHLGSRAVGGAALVIAEASAVEARGRISPDDLGIYKDEHVAFLRRIARFISDYGACPGIQIAHAGRKASTVSPHKSGSRSNRGWLTPDQGGWEIVGPSALPFSPEAIVPRELSYDEIHEIVAAFGQAARRAREADFKWLEIHAAHGYLLHSFYSPLSNRRTDEYGGSFENRIRILLETVESVQNEWPARLPLSVRISASDWVEGGWTVDDSVQLGKILRERGIDMIDCSSGFIRSGDRYEQGPGWQVPLSEAVRKQAKILTAAVGMISEPRQADEIIRSGKSDIVMIARSFITDPYWPYHAARALGQSEPSTLPTKYTYAV